MFDNMLWLGPLEFALEEQEFARKIQTAAGVAPKGLDGTIRPWRDPKPVSSGAPSSESPAEQAPEVVFQTEGRLKHS